ncbi:MULTISPECIES: hypothetical protein [unclassified Legionella]|uniref:hypothetical protein n=1 Tax=unclassified Legionella TaxID=2622702 RepID=UPI0010568777|nr:MULTISPECIES: hypothetical protein [unclassified Legionella]MDI9818295.1 hypothetical protein [Legionella sp. PL877]
MKKITIEFTQDEVHAIATITEITANVLNIEHIVQEGLTEEEWALLKRIIDIDVILIPDKRGNIRPVSPDTIIQKINKAIKKAD